MALLYEQGIENLLLLPSPLSADIACTCSGLFQAAAGVFSCLSLHDLESL